MIFSGSNNLNKCRGVSIDLDKAMGNVEWTSKYLLDSVRFLLSPPFMLGHEQDPLVDNLRWALNEIVEPAFKDFYDHSAYWNVSFEPHIADDYGQWQIGGYHRDIYEDQIRYRIACEVQSPKSFLDINFC